MKDWGMGPTGQIICKDRALNFNNYSAYTAENPS